MNGYTKINTVLHLPIICILNRFKAGSENSEAVIGITAIVKRDRNLNTLSLETCPSSMKPHVLHRNINQKLVGIDSDH